MSTTAAQHDGCPAPAVGLQRRERLGRSGGRWRMCRSHAAGIRLATRHGFSVAPYQTTLSEGIGLMPQRLRLRRPHWWWLIPLCVAVVALVAAAGPAAPTSARASSARAAITSAQCETQVNDTPSKLLPCIQTDDLWNHMKAFQAIADANPGPDGMPSRNSGEPGYKASADYVAKLMKEAGYDVTIQTYKFFYFAYTGIPTFKEISPTSHDFGVSTEWNPGQSTGTATADLQPAGGIVVPPTPTPSSPSGCTAADFSGFVTGRIALIQREIGRAHV